MIVYGTFSGFKNERMSPNKFKWVNLVNEVGEKVNGGFWSEMDVVFGPMKLKMGGRYRLECDLIENRVINNITRVLVVNKNPRCDIFRRFKDEYHIISGKYEGKKVHEIPYDEMSDYCVWLAKHTINEATIKNTLDILKAINK